MQAVVQKPYFDPKHLPFPPVALRWALACGQMLIYHERFLPSPRQLRLYRAAVAASEGELDPKYRAKVTSEFVSAAKHGSTCNGTASKPGDSAEGAPQDIGADSSGSDSLLDAVCTRVVGLSAADPATDGFRTAANAELPYAWSQKHACWETFAVTHCDYSMKG